MTGIILDELAYFLEKRGVVPSYRAKQVTDWIYKKRVGSFDAGLGSSYLSRIVGQKKAREIWFLCRQYDAQQALEMGLVNTVVPVEKLEEETLQWCREMLELSPMALRFLKAAMNADCDGQIGLLDLGGSATLLYYLSEEAQEGRNAFVEKRDPDFSRFPKRP